MEGFTLQYVTVGPKYKPCKHVHSTYQDAKDCRYKRGRSYASRHNQCEPLYIHIKECPAITSVTPFEACLCEGGFRGYQALEALRQDRWDGFYHIHNFKMLRVMKTQDMIPKSASDETLLMWLGRVAMNAITDRNIPASGAAAVLHHLFALLEQQKALRPRLSECPFYQAVLSESSPAFKWYKEFSAGLDAILRREGVFD